MIVLDSDILIDVSRHFQPAEQWLASTPMQIIAAPGFVGMELLQGCKSKMQIVSGFTVPKGDSHHFRVIHSLEFTPELDAMTITLFDRHRKKRSGTVYDVAGAVTDAEVKSMRELAVDLVDDVHAWLLQYHKALMKT
jgi:predicted nucleic acid-binding protein